MSQLNKLELAIIKEISKLHPELENVLYSLNVSHREYTGVGSYTDFEPLSDSQKANFQFNILDLPAIIELPELKYGLGAHIQIKNNSPEFLEIYAYGDCEWDGKYTTFSFNYSAD